MSSDEIIAIQKAKDKSERAGWEQARMISFFTVVGMQGTGKIKSPKDLYTFPWDEVKKKPKPMTREEAQQKIKQLQGGSKT